MYSRVIVNIFFIGKASQFFKNFNTKIYSDTTNVIVVKLCMMALLIELYMFIPLSVTMTIFQGHSNVKQF